MKLTDQEQRAYQKIKSEKLKNIYAELVLFSRDLKGIDVQQIQTGSKFSFRYYAHDNTCPCSFIVNEKSVLFYFRNPEKNRRSVEHRLQQHRIEFNTNGSGEITFRITDETDISVIKALVTEYCR